MNESVSYCSNSLNRHPPHMVVSLCPPLVFVIRDFWHASTPKPWGGREKNAKTVGGTQQRFKNFPNLEREEDGKRRGAGIFSPPPPPFGGAIGRRRVDPLPPNLP